MILKPKTLATLILGKPEATQNCWTWDDWNSRQPRPKPDDLRPKMNQSLANLNPTIWATETRDSLVQMIRGNSISDDLGQLKLVTALWPKALPYLGLGFRNINLLCIWFCRQGPCHQLRYELLYSLYLVVLFDWVFCFTLGNCSLPFALMYIADNSVNILVTYSMYLLPSRFPAMHSRIRPRLKASTTPLPPEAGLLDDTAAVF